MTQIPEPEVLSGSQVSRRALLGGVAAATAFTILPRHVLGGSGFRAPSDKLNIASVGAGGMASSNIDKCTGENIVALCDVDEKSAAKTFAKFANVPRYKDFRVMLEKQKDIDAVIVAIPDHAHCVAALAAMQLKKHVYVQKPLTRTVAEARALTEAARKYKVATQMGNQGHSGEGVRLIAEWIADGAIGKVREVHCWTNRPVWPQGMLRPKETPPVPANLDWDLWVGPSPMRPYNPAYLPFFWRAWVDFGAGALGDMGCHVMDAAYYCLKLGYPSSVEAMVSEICTEPWKKLDHKLETYPMASIVHLEFPARGKMPPVKLHWYDGGLKPQRPAELEINRKLPESGTIFVGEKGKIMCETYSESPRLIPETKMKAYKKPKKTITRVTGTHEQNWIDACKGGPPACSNFDYSGPFTETVVMGNLAIQFPGQKLIWDGPSMKVTNFDAANEFVYPKYRDGYSLKY